MQSITRSRWFPHSPTTIYSVLSNPDKLARVVKRLHSVTVLERTGDQGAVRAVIDLPGGKFIETEGHVEGLEDQNLHFQTEQPFPLKISWALQSETQDTRSGTAVEYTVAVDFSPVLAFISGMVLNGFLSSEMEGDLQRLTDLLIEDTTA